MRANCPSRLLKIARELLESLASDLRRLLEGTGRQRNLRPRPVPVAVRRGIGRARRDDRP